MKLVTFLRDGAQRLGALAQRDGQDVVIDLNRAVPDLPHDMIAFLNGGDEVRARAARVVAIRRLSQCSIALRCSSQHLFRIPVRSSVLG